MCTILDASNLLPPLLREERLEDQRNDAQRRCFEQRLRVAQRELVMALSEDIQGRFSSTINRADPILLWRTLGEHFDSNPGVNVVFLKRDMLNRRLQHDERLDSYIKDIDDYKTRLRRANQQLPEEEAVMILLSNTVGVYPAVVNEHEVRLARDETISWEQAIERLRLAEHSRQETERQQGRSVQRDVAYVGNRGGGGGRGGGGRSSSRSRGNNRNQPRGRARSPSRSPSPQGRNKRAKSKSSSRNRESVASRKAKSKCNACGRQGHWAGDRECSESSDSRGGQRPRSFAGIVTVKKVKPAAPATVLAVQETHVQRTASDKIEWILDNGAQASITRDLSLYTELHNDAVSELKFGNGTVERAQLGTVSILVKNQHTGKHEERLLEDVSYSKTAPYNLISQTYLQFRCGFKVTLSDDQLITWLTKDSLKLRFDYDRGHYRMWTSRTSKAVLSVKTSQVENPMALLHNRLGHANMDTIQAMAAQKYKFGINTQQQSFAPYECVPCIESKTKRMSYSRGPARVSKKLIKLCVDLCSVGVDTVSNANQFMLVVDEATRFKWGFLLKSKAEATTEIKALMLQLATKFPKHKTEVLFSDGGGEFINAELKAFCGERGIELRSSNPYSPQENSIVERSNQTVMRQVRSMLHATQLPPSLWGEAFLHAIETLNYTPTTALKNNMTPSPMRHYTDGVRT
ncbi:Integrase, catalytic core protein [Phytophthora megakarya]|uniref:Integrase, catalytic core protein n=1 Tax=Phytophthora megakarya TaxID=4795 RepID=A0A225VW79_9STRA|nr:Integrase, catalytic core protein [Phytophthora megakarya]